MSEDIVLNEKQAQTRQGIMRILACYEKILKEKRCFCLPDFTADFSMSPSGFHVLPPLHLDDGHNNPHDSPTIHEKAPPP